MPQKIRIVYKPAYVASYAGMLFFGFRAAGVSAHTCLSAYINKYVRSYIATLLTAHVVISSCCLVAYSLCGYLLMKQPAYLPMLLFSKERS